MAKPLRSVGFGTRKPAFFSLLGVTQYLTAQAMDAVFSYVARLPPGSGIAFSFNPPEDELHGLDLEEARSAARRAAGFGEPWLTRLGADGFTERLHRLASGALSIWIRTAQPSGTLKTATTVYAHLGSNN